MSRARGTWKVDPATWSTWTKGHEVMPGERYVVRTREGILVNLLVVGDGKLTVEMGSVRADLLVGLPVARRVPRGTAAWGEQ